MDVLGDLSIQLMRYRKNQHNGFMHGDIIIVYIQTNLCLFEQRSDEIIL